MIRPCGASSRIALIFGCLIACASARVALAEDELPSPIAAALQRAAIPAGAASFYVQEVGAFSRREARHEASAASGAMTVAPARFAVRGEFRPLLSVRSDRPMNPASTMKLVTTYAALELLGPAYTWKTVAASNAPVVGATLEGDLYLRGAGDPKLVYESFWLLLRQLRARGIQSLHGDLVLDRGLFDAGAYDPSAFDNEPVRPYNVGPDALLVNFKAIALRFIPDDAKREVRVTAEPPLADFTIDAVPYADGPCGDWKARVAADFTRRDRVAFAGAFAGSCGEQNWNVAVLDHRQYVGALFKKLWSELGGTFQGKVRDGALPIDARVLAERESPSLAEIVRDINKYSNNVMAKELYLSLAAEVLKLQANPDRAQRVIRNFFSNKGIAMPELVIENGSGLSRRERISALSMARLLQAAWSSPVMPEFVSSLSLVGYDGTMRRRLNQKSVAGQAHIKTGTLNDARAVAGYVTAASGKRYVVVCFVNHANAGAAQAAQDALLQWVYERG